MGRRNPDTPEPGYAGLPLVELNGGQQGNFAGLYVATGGTKVAGLDFVEFQQSAIALIGDGSSATSGNAITKNVIGVDPSGTTAIKGTVKLGNQVVGIQDINSLSATIFENTVSGNVGVGIELEQASGSNFQNNSVGTDVTQQKPLGNSAQGILVSDSSNVTITGNVVSGNGLAGIQIQATSLPSTQELISGNFIGTNSTGKTAISNGGNGILLIGNPSSSTNTVFNNAITGNSVSGNKDSGIEVKAV